MRPCRWAVRGRGILRSCPSRLEVGAAILTTAVVLVVPALWSQRQVARREHLVRQGERFLDQMVGNLDRVERNLSTIHTMIEAERIRLSRQTLAVAEPPPIVLPPDEPADAAPLAETPPAVELPAATP